MKIAFISYDFGEYCVHHANALAEHAEVMLILANDVFEGHGHLVSPKVRLNTFDRPRFRQPLRQFVSIRKILDTVHSYNPDVVHFQGGHLWFNLALPLLRQYPLVLTVHNPRHHVGDLASRKTPQFVMDYGFRRADQIIVHGDRIHVIPHIAMGQKCQSSCRTEDPRMVLFFGRIWEYKGLEYLIRAEPYITERVPDVRIVIAGEGEDFDRYRKMIHNSERFEIHNEHVSNERREQLFAKSALVVLPYISATQSGVVPIAYTHSKPVVATNVGSLQEFVDDGATGILVPPKDEIALADAIVTLLMDEPLRHRLGRNGLQKLESECEPDVVAQAHLKVYAATRRFRDNAHVDVVASSINKRAYEG